MEVLDVDNLESLDYVSNMLMDAHNEMDPLKFSAEVFKYMRYLKDCKHVYHDERGFFIVSESPQPLVLGTPMNYVGEMVYIRPEFRKTKALSEYYGFMFDTFDGDFIAIAQSSEKDKIMGKRAEYIGKLYKFNRSTFKKDT